MKPSISSVKLFKACRRAYWLKYIEGLEPVQRADALETGLSYHSKLESLYTDGTFDSSDFSKESAMAGAYMTYIYPRIPSAIVEVEITRDGFYGRLDGVTVDGYILEHKTTAVEIGEEYEYSLMWDEQVLAYMWLSGLRKCYYTAIRKPTIRKKRGEGDEEFYQRILDWYEEDTKKKINLFTVAHSDQEVETFAEDLKETLQDIDSCSHWYRNCLHCSRWGRRCEYESICMSYDPCQMYVDFIRRE